MKSENFNAIPEEWHSTSKMFVALGDEQRQRILLAFAPGERLSLLQILSTSSLSRTAVTYHLRVLREAGALRSEKIGKEVFFWIDKAAILQALGGVMDYIEKEI